MSTLYEQSAPALYVCGLGSSAGGLEALSAFLQQIPHTGRFAFVVAQHLSPQHPSMLAELLAREAAIDVVEIKDGMKIEADAVYVTPPAWDVEVAEGKLRLREPDSKMPKPSVDRLFESIAREYGAMALAVVLSGTGSDGSRGANAVKSAGGHVFVQDPATARYEGMPAAALDTGCAYGSDSPERLWKRIEEMLHGTHLIWRQLDKETLVEGVLQEIRRVTSIDFRGYKRGTLARRIYRRMRALGVDEISGYLDLLKTDEGEARRLSQSCLISVTGFFRDAPAFDRMRHLMAVHLSRTANDIRIWVPGCATGEEAYSLAMLCHDIAPQRRVQIFATDIDADAVEVARRAVYSDARLRGVDRAFREQYFLGEGQAFKVVKFIRDSVIFARHDVLRDPLFVNLDLISCRNFLIYLRPPVQLELLRKFHYALRPAGMLFLGKPETAPEDVFETLEQRAKIFRAKTLPTPVKAAFHAVHTRKPERLRQAATGAAGRNEQLRSVLLSQFVPAAVLVDAAMRILDTHGDVGRYLTLKPGGVDMTLLTLAPKALQAALRAQLYHCRRSGKLSRSFPRPVEVQNRMAFLQTVVMQAPASTPQEPVFVVAFTEVPQQAAGAPEVSDSGSDRSGQMERDLIVMRENLHSAIEELETSNEELQTLNEELQSNNQELQATNEEFQAANEELHSANEELVTVNEELEQKSVQLAAAVEDLGNVQNSIQSPMLVVDGACHLRQSNLAAERELGLTAGAGRPLVLCMDHDLGVKLEAQVRKVLASGRATEWKLLLGKKHYNVVTNPYRSGDGNDCTGAVVLFHDTTGMVKANQRYQVTESRLRAMTAQQTSIINGIPAQIALVGHDGLIHAVNEQWRSFSEHYPVFGESLLVGKNLVRLFTESSGEAKEPAQAMAMALQKILAGNAQSFSIDYPCHSPSQQRWFKCQISPFPIDGRNGALVTKMDITRQTQMYEQMKRQHVALQSTLNAVFITDAEGKIDWANDAFQRLSGYALKDVLGKKPSFLNSPEDVQRYESIIGECLSGGSIWQGEVLQKAKDGKLYVAHQTVTPIPSTRGELTHFVFVQEDLTRHKQVQERMLYVAEHDTLTGLLNRKSFQERLSDAIERRTQTGGSIAVLFLDIDRFKETNDTLGHLVGDQLLVEMAGRLKQNLRERDVLARFGGDEFVMFLEDLTSREGLSLVVDRIQHSLTRPFEIEGRSLFSSASMGAAIFPEDGRTVEDLLKNADHAMYRAKAEGRRGFRFYDERLETDVIERLSVERELSRALESRQLWTAFQPQWQLHSGLISGAECLLRWDRAQAPPLPVSRIITIAEESGLILPIGQWLIREAITRLGRWVRMGMKTRMSINLSAVQFHQQDVFSIIVDALRAETLPANLLKVEITESVLLHKSKRVAETLHALHGAGVGLVLDDFGTGYSSLSYLQQYPIETVKIDASFVRGIGLNRNDEAIVAGIVQMAHSLGQNVVAEGVETAVQQDFLRACRCDEAQGFLFSEAVPAEAFEKLLAAKPALDAKKMKAGTP
ncbi:MAG: EAL domain-containing protein [Bryobacterales bacterium]|nr:EAL domain-containing protein [Bryobacterales bacterium]